MSDAALPVTLAQFKAQLNDDESPTDPDAAAAHDAELTLHLTAATERIEDEIGPIVTRGFVDVVQPPQEAYQHHYDRRRYRKLLLRNRPVVEVTDVSAIINGVITVIDGFDPAAQLLDGEAGVLTCFGWISSMLPYQVTYTAGRGTIDDIQAKIKEAVLITGEHLWDTQRGRGLRPSRWGTQADPGEVPEILRGFALPRRALELLGLEQQVVFG